MGGGPSERWVSDAWPRPTHLSTHGPNNTEAEGARDQADTSRMKNWTQGLIANGLKKNTQQKKPNRENLRREICTNVPCLHPGQQNGLSCFPPFVCDDACQALQHSKHLCCLR